MSTCEYVCACVSAGSFFFFSVGIDEIELSVLYNLFYILQNELNTYCTWATKEKTSIGWRWPAQYNFLLIFHLMMVQLLFISNFSLFSQNNKNEKQKMMYWMAIERRVNLMVQPKLYNIPSIYLCCNNKIDWKWND